MFVWMTRYRILNIFHTFSDILRSQSQVMIQKLSKESKEMCGLALSLLMGMKLNADMSWIGQQRTGVTDADALCFLLFTSVAVSICRLETASGDVKAVGVLCW